MDEAKQFLQALADRHGGILTPDIVLEAAQDKASPIHHKFTWNNREAAHKRRLDEARALIREVRIEVRTTRFAYTVPAFVRDPAAAPGQGYVSMGRLQTDEEKARDVIVREMQKASTALARARGIAAVLGLDKQIEEIEGQIIHLTQDASRVAT